jgi:hypothetical protein
MARIITSEADIPFGWKRFFDITTNKTDQKALSTAHEIGKLDAVKLMRTTGERAAPVWMDPVAAHAFLSQCQAKSDAAVKAKQQIEPTAVTPPVATPEGAPAMQMAWLRFLIHGLLERTERIAVALENIATTPKSTEDQGDEQTL